ncbi:hypothetical protein [uncultured Paracoccus sp.]|uniref:hypothetical protein n=1 Tax=uncultured Paracoccus sp. TaxID=189685 RepID=UPI002601AB31|nr:hypothetical protein [uncultured Paracoccus sp.]
MNPDTIARHSQTKAKRRWMGPLDTGHVFLPLRRAGMRAFSARHMMSRDKGASRRKTGHCKSRSEIAELTRGER